MATLATAAPNALATSNAPANRPAEPPSPVLLPAVAAQTGQVGGQANGIGPLFPGPYVGTCFFLPNRDLEALGSRRPTDLDPQNSFLAEFALAKQAGLNQASTAFFDVEFL